MNGFYIRIFLWVLLNFGNSNDAGFWIWNWWLVVSKGSTLVGDVSYLLGSFWKSRLLRIVFAGTCGAILIPLSRMKMFGCELSVTSKGAILPVISVL